MKKDRYQPFLAPLLVVVFVVGALSGVSISNYLYQSSILNLKGKSQHSYAAGYRDGTQDRNQFFTLRENVLKAAGLCGYAKLSCPVKNH